MDFQVELLELQLELPMPQQQLVGQPELLELLMEHPQELMELLLEHMVLPLALAQVSDIQLQQAELQEQLVEQ